MHAQPARPLVRAALAAAAVLAFGSGACRGPERPPVILITIDTLRADAVGAWGGLGLPTPALDAIAAEGALFERAYAPIPRTTQGIATLLTGLHPLHHGADGLGMELPSRIETLAERFAAAGWSTAAFVSNVNLRPGLGYEQGFALYANPEVRWRGNSAASITSEALSWLDARDDGGPPFLWVHYLDPHWPYTPPPEWEERADPGFRAPYRIDERQAAGELTKGRIIFEADRVMDARMIEHVRRLYVAEVAATDAAIGRLVDGLRERGLWERAIVVVTSDHGEALGEHRYWFAHGEYLYDDTCRVPLVIRAPGRVPAGRRIAGAASLEDVAPTLLSLAGLEPTAATDGLDLSSLLRSPGEAEIAAREMLHLGDFRLIHPENPRYHRPGRAGRWRALRAGRLKLVVVPGPDGGPDEVELYDLAADPAESANLANSRPDDVARLRARLDELLAAYGARAGDEEVPADEDSRIRDAMRGLGYVD
ncbi:MAG: hypothetical protein D6738_04330 [Acidobacteria bacterium]|nr:MAG: hypothetical protein D6738_04330 [Acidobacteriota bacterium]